jgi:phage tail tape-measure protein
MSKSTVAILIAAALGLGLVFVAGCETEAQKGAGIGALAGAGIGAIVGHQSGNTAGGALIGGAVGGGTGYMLGNEGDKKRTNEEISNVRQEMNIVTVNIKNSNGSTSQVTLRKQGVGYVGQRGEFYDHLPTEAELKPVYGF